MCGVYIKAIIMKFLTINYIKQHSRVDFDCEDELLELYGDSAEETVAGILNRGNTVDECVESLKEQYGTVPANIYHAALMLVEIGYTQRGPVSQVNLYVVPYAFDMLIKNYMRLTNG